MFHDLPYYLDCSHYSICTKEKTSASLDNRFLALYAAAPIFISLN